MTTCDDFLGGLVKLTQHKNGLRATSDSVLVAAFVPAKTGDSVLDVGTGNGVVALCLNARVGGLKMTGIDCQEHLLALAKKNAEINNADLTLVSADISKKPSPIHGLQYHHVVTNPPFYDEPNARRNPTVAKAYQEGMPLSVWLDFCLRHIRAKGTLTLIHRPEQLSEILSVLSGRIGAIDIIPIVSKEGQPAKRIIVRGRMNSKRALKLYSPIVMHTQDDKRTEIADDILRNGKAPKI